MLRLVRSLSTLALLAADKTVALTGQCHHFHKGAVVAPAFTAPVLAPHIQFGPTTLAAGIARNATLRHAPAAPPRGHSIALRAPPGIQSD